MHSMISAFGVFVTASFNEWADKQIRAFALSQNNAAQDGRHCQPRGSGNQPHFRPRHLLWTRSMPTIARPKSTARILGFRHPSVNASPPSSRNSSPATVANKEAAVETTLRTDITFRQTALARSRLLFEYALYRSGKGRAED